jgi:hypothetical protein
MNEIKRIQIAADCFAKIKELFDIVPTINEERTAVIAIVEALREIDGARLEVSDGNHRS